LGKEAVLEAARAADDVWVGRGGRIAGFVHVCFEKEDIAAREVVCV